MGYQPSVCIVYSCLFKMAGNCPKRTIKIQDLTPSYKLKITALPLDNGTTKNDDSPSTVAERLWIISFELLERVHTAVAMVPSDERAI